MTGHVGYQPRYQDHPHRALGGILDEEQPEFRRRQAVTELLPCLRRLSGQQFDRHAETRHRYCFQRLIQAVHIQLFIVQFGVAKRQVSDRVCCGLAIQPA